MNNFFDRRIQNLTNDWSKPLVDVVDTADAIRLALKDWEIDSPDLILGLTKLALERYDAQEPTANQKLAAIIDFDCQSHEP